MRKKLWFGLALAATVMVFTACSGKEKKAEKADTIVTPPAPIAPMVITQKVVIEKEVRVMTPVPVFIGGTNGMSNVTVIPLAVTADHQSQIVIGNSGKVFFGGSGDYESKAEAGSPAKSASTKSGRIWPKDVEPTTVINPPDCIAKGEIDVCGLKPKTITNGDDLKIVIPDGYGVSVDSDTKPNCDVAFDGTTIPSAPTKSYDGSVKSHVQHHEVRIRLRPGASAENIKVTYYRI